MRIAGIAVWGLILPWTTCIAMEPGLSRFEFHETHMGCDFKLVLYTIDDETARRASVSAYQRIARLNRILSDYDPDSELMRLCEKAGGPPVEVSAELFYILERSQEMSRRSGGAFDVTVNPVVRLWRRAQRDRRLPDREALDKARDLVGYQNVRLDAKARTVQLSKPGVKLDLGGIAKGYAAGEAIVDLRAHGVPRALAAAAGDIVVGDPPPGETGWKVGIGPLDQPGGTPTRFVRIQNAAVSTSGDAERYVEIGGKRYSHIVDPRTGYGVVDRASVTVVAPDGATADSLDTAAYILGPERGLELVESVPGAAALIVRSEGGKTRTYESMRWTSIAAKP